MPRCRAVYPKPVAAAPNRLIPAYRDQTGADHCCRDVAAPVQETGNDLTTRGVTHKDKSRYLMLLLDLVERAVHEHDFARMTAFVMVAG